MAKPNNDACTIRAGFGLLPALLRILRNMRLKPCNRPMPISMISKLLE